MSAPRTAAYFDQWYADMENTPAKDEIEQRRLGLPPHLQSTSLLTWDGIAEVTDALRLAPGEVLLDLACGRGGYGLEVARRTALHNEALRSIEHYDRRRRVFGTATAPA